MRTIFLGIEVARASGIAIGVAPEMEDHSLVHSSFQHGSLQKFPLQALHSFGVTFADGGNVERRGRQRGGGGQEWEEAKIGMRWYGVARDALNRVLDDPNMFFYDVKFHCM